MNKVVFNKHSFTDEDFIQAWRKLGVFRWDSETAEWKMPSNTKAFCTVENLETLAFMSDNYTGDSAVLRDSSWLNAIDGMEVLKNARGIKSFEEVVSIPLDVVMGDSIFDMGWPLCSGSIRYLGRKIYDYLEMHHNMSSLVSCFLCDIIPARALAIYVMADMFDLSVPWRKECMSAVEAFRAGWIPVGILKDKTVVLPLNYEALREEWQRVSSEGGEP